MTFFVYMDCCCRDSGNAGPDLGDRVEQVPGQSLLPHVVTAQVSLHVVQVLRQPRGSPVRL